MKKILFLSALIICVCFTTCEETDNSGPGGSDPVNCEITFDPNGGTGGQTQPVTATEGQAMPAITAAPTREDYTFTGYFDAETGGTKYYNADLSSARTWNKKTDTKLFAQWSASGGLDLNSSKVSIVQSNKAQATDLTFDDIKALITEAVRMAGGLEGIIKTGDTVVLKPNLVTGNDFTSPGWQGRPLAVEVNGNCTDWRVVKAVAQIVRDIIGPSGKIWVMEGSGSGSTTTIMNALKYTKTDIPEVDEFIPLESEGTWTSAGNGGGENANYVVKVELDDYKYKTATGSYANYYKNDGVYYVNKKMYEADALICLPTLKNHWHAVVTGAIKNISIGASPPRIYGIASTNIGRNNMVNHEARNFHDWIADYYTALPVDFVIMDGLQGLENGPTPCYEMDRITDIAQSQKNMRCILASKDALAIDTVETNVINWDLDTVSYLQYLTEAGKVGNGNPKDITVFGKKVDDIRSDFAGTLPPAGGSKLTTAQKTPPTLTIQSAAFDGQTLNINLDISANTDKIDIYIDGDYAGSVSTNMAEIAFDPAGLGTGSHTIKVISYTRYMYHAEASTTVTR